MRRGTGASPSSTARPARRLEGFRLACRELDIPCQEEYIAEGLFRHPRLSYQQTVRLLKLPQPPTCVLYPDDVCCIGAITMLTNAGVRVPQDLSVIGYDGIMMSQLIHPRLTTCLQDTQEAAHLAMEALTDAIEHPDTHVPARRLFPPRILTGDTLRPL